MDADGARTPLAPEEPDSARLDSWKAIATYLGRGVTTVQRWEREEGLPVRRHAHAVRGSVFAFRHEIDVWRRNREQPPASVAPPGAEVAAREPGEPAPPIPRRGRSWALSLGLIAALAAAVSVLVVARRSAGGASVLVSGGTPRVLDTGDGLVYQPTLSPDGRLVAFMRREGAGSAIFVAPTAGGASRRVAIDEPGDPARFDGFPRWSPDGRQIAFLRQVRSAVWTVRVIPADGGVSRGLVTIHTASVSWMPDARTLVVLDRHAQGQPYAAYRVEVGTGARVEQLTHPPDGSFGDWQCAVSPDGWELALVRRRTEHQADVWVVDLRTRSERRLTSGMRGIEGIGWSPDARFVVFSALDGANTVLWQVSSRPAGGEQPRPIPGTEGGRSPSASRTTAGGPAALAYVRLSTIARIWRWDPGVDAPRALMESGTRDEQPALSPDGKQLAFVSSRTGAPELWVRAAEGGEPRRLTFAGARVATPRWSPDGTRLVYTAWAGDNPDIYTVRADGTAGSWRLTFEQSDDANPSWSNDGRSVYFRSDRDGLPRIWRIGADGGAAAAVTRGEGSEALESADGTQVLFVRNRNVPGLWAVPVRGGAETLVQSGVWEGYWAVTREGLVIFDRPTRSMTDPMSVRLIDPRVAVSRQLGVMPVPSSHVPLGVSANADARRLAWATSEQRDARLMIVPRWPGH